MYSVAVMKDALYFVTVKAIDLMQQKECQEG